MYAYENRKSVCMTENKARRIFSTINYSYYHKLSLKLTTPNGANFCPSYIEHKAYLQQVRSKKPIVARM